MKKREFNKLLNSCRDKTKKLLDIEKIKSLTDTQKNDMLHHIVRNRGPILIELLTPLVDRTWLACYGYWRITKGRQFTFLHTSEHQIR